tara:strand:+ start:370 stop:774 length:405 start_codon:yes stop_codon:yes gene_type:complete
MARLGNTLLALLFAILASTSASIAAAESSAEVGIQDNPIASSEESVAAGRTIYGRFCRSCHGQRADGRGMAAPPGSRPANLIDAEWDYGSSDAEIFKVLKEGIPPKYDMDAWEGRISDDDMWNVINFLRDLAAN